MKNVLLQRAIKLNKVHRYRNGWRKVVGTMAAVVAFCTVYALILPAITMEREPVCGLEAHEHGEACYEQQTAAALICGLQETAPHAHDETCWVLRDVRCELEEGEEHTHSESCLTEPVLSCGLEETQGHAHGEACYAEGEPEPILICKLEEHVHEDACYPVEDLAEITSGYLCGMGEHVHTRTCAAGPMACSVPEHTHEAACLVEGVDLTADVETPDQWEALLVPVELTGIWADDILAVAGTQLGYAESEKNLVLTDGSLMPYSRYGQWMNDPYSDWNIKFIAFCVHYAGVENFPVNEDLDAWIQALGEETQYAPNTYNPQSGDIVFFDYDQRMAADTGLTVAVEADDAALIAEVDTKNGLLKTIRRTESGVVDYVEYPLTDPAIMGYALLPGGPNAKEELPLTLTAETENYMVTVTRSEEVVLPEGAELRVTEYAKDSEIFLRRSEEAGYELEWLLNIGFYVGNAELDLDGKFSVVVTSKNGDTLGEDITHFADSGIEQLEATIDEADTATVTFDAEGFSDYGGGTNDGPMLMAVNGYPTAVTTGTVHVNRLRFYNLCENGDKGISPLAGCVFEITGSNGYKATVTSTDEVEVQLPAGIPDGTYTITEISVPDGYIRDDQYQRQFRIQNGILASNFNIGTFINHNSEQLDAVKTGEVEDYNNRIYQILLAAESHMRKFEMDPVDVLFVVDQSNSMLFPSGLTSTGKTVNIHLNEGLYNLWNWDQLDLDKNQVYYVIADPQGTSTVWAVWWSTQYKTWMTQDASYYAKAWHNNATGYKDDNERAIFPENLSYNEQKNAEKNTGTRSNGCGMGKDLSGGSLGSYIDKNGGVVNFTVYTASDEYNRLHYLEEALVNMIYELADVNPQNRVTLTEFTKVVNETNDCHGPYVLTTHNVERLVTEVRSINTSGGTRQDIALKHVYQNHLSVASENYKDKDHTYTILITDGAPVVSSDDVPNQLGSANDWVSTSANSIYAQIKGWAREVRKESTLMTVSLGMQSVDAGRQVLREIASSNEFYCALDDASDLVENIQKLMFEGFRPKDYIHMEGDVVDEISDSFYPIAWTNANAGTATGRKLLAQSNGKDWILLNEGDWITLEGKYTTAGTSNAAGQLLRKSDGTFYIQWLNVDLTHEYSADHRWRGTFYVKAKEDFIGGNAIDTNKSATVTADGSAKKLDTPTVNVRLLGMNENSSEVTLYKGDIINEPGNAPIDALKRFFNEIRFSKLVDGEGDVLNKVQTADGLESALFYLRYAIGRDLSDAEWTALANGTSVSFPYTYDDASSHGSVGGFVVRLEKSGTTANYHSHEATAVCQPNGQPLTENCTTPAEVYTLEVNYTAYRLGQNGRPNNNVNNGTGSPGTQVGTGATLETGYGIVTSDNTHEVHVIDGTITVTKRFADGITDPADRTFSFTLHRAEDGTDTIHDVTKSITIPANSQNGTASISFRGLKRGTYTVTEAVDDTYTVDGITVLGTTNCYSTPSVGNNAKEVTFVMGHNTANENVISKTAGAAYTSYADPVNGVFGAAEFTNEPITYTGEVPVKKIWDNGVENHVTDFVHVVLYLDDTVVLDGDGRAKILRLDSANDWQDVFTVILKDRNDSVENYKYSVREVTEISPKTLVGWQAAVLENDKTTTLYYERAAESGDLVGAGGSGYMVYYDTDENGVLTVTNAHAVSLPKTGGAGTYPYTFGGLLLVAVSLVVDLCFFRRQGKRGKRSG